jgi:hypothetical protein
MFVDKFTIGEQIELEVLEAKMSVKAKQVRGKPNAIIQY